MAGAVFGDVGVSLFVAAAASGEILGDRRRARRCVFPYKIHLDGEILNLRERAVCGLWFSCSDHVRFMLRSRSDYGRIVLLLAAAFDGFFAKILNLHFLRKFRRFRAFSDLGLLLLVCLLW